MNAMQVRTMTADDRSEVAELIYCSINSWYRAHGAPAIFVGGPRVTEVYFDVYNDLNPGCGIVAVNEENGRIMGSCFYHPRKHHMSLGIMTVHPNYFGSGVGRALLRHIIDESDRRGYKSLRLTQSAINVDSFSLYNKAGFVPRHAYQDMYLRVPENGVHAGIPGVDRVRPATLDDVPGMAELEMEVSGISREEDYRYCIENRLGFWRVSVIESAGRKLDGFLISSGHTAVNILGPAVARTEEDAAALLVRELNHHKGRSPVFLIPMEKHRLVRQMYELGARVCEMHFCQVRGDFQPFQGVSMPSFLPETG